MTNKHMERCRISNVRRVGALSPPHPLACCHQRQPRATRLRSLQPPSSQPLGRSQGGSLWEPAGGSPKGEEQTRNTHANNCSLKPLPLGGYPVVTAICGDRILRRRRRVTGPVQAEGCESLQCPPSTLQGKMDVVCSEHGTRISSATQSRVFAPELDASHNVMLREEKPGPTQHRVCAQKSYLTTPGNGPGTPVGGVTLASVRGKADAQSAVHLARCRVGGQRRFMPGAHLRKGLAVPLRGVHLLWSESPCPPNAHVDIVTPRVMIVGGGWVPGVEPS